VVSAPAPPPAGDGLVSAGARTGQILDGSTAIHISYVTSIEDAYVTIPEYGEVWAATPLTVVLTSIRTRERHDALKRRCLCHSMDDPRLAREIETIRSRLPDVSAHLATQVAAAMRRIRTSANILKPPGVAESLRVRAQTSRV
jgi:MoxR-like ATPase